MSKSERIEAPFTNKFGHVFQPGDNVIAITTSYGDTTIDRVQYLGYLEFPGHRGTTDKKVQVRRPRYKQVLVYKESKELVPYPYPGDSFSNLRGKVEWIDVVESMIVTTLQKNLILPDVQSRVEDEVA